MPTMNEQLAGYVDPTTQMILRAMAQAGSPGTAAVSRETLQEALGQPLPVSERATLWDRLGAVASFAGNALPLRGGIGRLLPGEADSPLIRRAIQRFGLTENMDEAGYVLPGGELLDFSGRGQAGGYVREGPYFISKRGPDYFAGQRYIDHREVSPLMRNPGGVKSPTELMDAFMGRTGAMRLQREGANVRRQPTEAQLRAIVRRSRETGTPLYLDVDIRGGNTVSRTFARPTVDAVQEWITEMLTRKRAP